MDFGDLERERDRDFDRDLERDLEPDLERTGLWLCDLQKKLTKNI